MAVMEAAPGKSGVTVPPEAAGMVVGAVETNSRLRPVRMVPFVSVTTEVMGCVLFWLTTTLVTPGVPADVGNAQLNRGWGARGKESGGAGRLREARADDCGAWSLCRCHTVLVDRYDARGLRREVQVADLAGDVVGGVGCGVLIDPGDELARGSLRQAGACEVGWRGDGCLSGERAAVRGWIC